MRLFKRHFLTLCVVLVAQPALAIILKYPDTIPDNINELPFYGNVQKTKEMLQLDETFTVSAIKSAGNAEKASAHLASRAWEAFQNRKLNDAMKRANQAWILDKKNCSAYWVMALIQSLRGAPKEDVDGLFKQALANVDSSNKDRLAQDYQTFLSGQEGHLVENKAQITEQYKKAHMVLLGE